MHKFLINQNNSIEDAFLKFNKNKVNYLVVTEDSLKVLGVITEGDIRRYFLEKKNTNAKIKDCMKTKYIYAKTDTLYEKCIKLLDDKIKFLPILDKKKRLVDIYTNENISYKLKTKNYNYHCRSPLRISFCGGGSDVTYFFKNYESVVLNATINLYSNCIVTIRNDSKIIISSHNLSKKIQFELSDGFHIVKKEYPNFEFVIELISIIKPQMGFNMTLYSDAPIGSGLGGSSALASSILGSLSLAFNKDYSKRDLSELSYAAERYSLNIPGGWQDQYSTVMGGFNIMKFSKKYNSIIPLNIKKDILYQLEDMIFLCFIDKKRNKINPHSDQIKNFKENSIQIKNYLRQNVRISNMMIEDIVNDQINSFIEKINLLWSLKKKTSSMISNKYVDKMINFLLKSGAKSTKLLGAGVGGYIIAFVPYENQQDFKDKLNKRNFNFKKINFDLSGLVSWRTLIDFN